MRQSIGTLCFLAILFSLDLVVLAIADGRGEVLGTLLRVCGAVLLVAPATQFAVNLMYFKMRDSLWGAFGSRRSALRAFLLDVLIGLTVIAAFDGLIGIATWDRMNALDSLYYCSAAGMAAAVIWILLARYRGPVEIRDTVWSMLDIEAA